MKARAVETVAALIAMVLSAPGGVGTAEAQPAKTFSYDQLLRDTKSVRGRVLSRGVILTINRRPGVMYAVVDVKCPKGTWRLEVPDATRMALFKDQDNNLLGMELANSDDKGREKDTATVDCRTNGGAGSGTATGNGKSTTVQ